MREREECFKCSNINAYFKDSQEKLEKSEDSNSWFDKEKHQISLLKERKRREKRYLGEKKGEKKRLIGRSIVISKVTMPLTKLS